MDLIKILIGFFGISFIIIFALTFFSIQSEEYKKEQRIQQVANEFCNEKGFEVARANGKAQGTLTGIDCYSTKQFCLKEICSDVIEKQQYFNPSDWQEKVKDD